jgi:hypothetical protein
VREELIPARVGKLGNQAFGTEFREVVAERGEPVLPPSCRDARPLNPLRIADGYSSPASAASCGDPFTASLLKLSEKVNEVGGDGLRKVVLCTEVSPDGRLNFAQ